MLQDVLEIVRQSGDIIRHQWTLPREVSHKGRIDLVTKTDVAVENFLKEHLKKLAPEVGFLAEESSADGAVPHEDCWIIDPVDGTTNFVHGIPVVGTSVALWRGGRTELGVVNVPLLNECFYAQRGAGAWRVTASHGDSSPVHLHVSSAASLSQAVVATGFPYDIQDKLPQILAWLQAVLPAAQGVRRLGAAAVDMAFVAAGRLDAFYEGSLKPWDLAAGWLLVEEAGGLVSNVQGREYRFGEVLLASNGLLHQDLSDLLKAVTEVQPS